jgi:hypothetical protein
MVGATAAPRKRVRGRQLLGLRECEEEQMLRRLLGCKSVMLALEKNSKSRMEQKLSASPSDDLRQPSDLTNVTKSSDSLPVIAGSVRPFSVQSVNDFLSTVLGLGVLRTMSD